MSLNSCFTFIGGKDIALGKRRGIDLSHSFLKTCPLIPKCFYIEMTHAKHVRFLKKEPRSGREKQHGNRSLSCHAKTKVNKINPSSIRAENTFKLGQYSFNGELLKRLAFSVLLKRKFKTFVKPLSVGHLQEYFKYYHKGEYLKGP